MMSGAATWYLNRGTGVVLLVLLTLVTVLGIAATGRGFSALWPRFATQALHRRLALLATVLLGVHATTAVVDDYVDITWWQALIPVGATYKPLWLGLGTLALDIFAALAITGALRSRMPARAWRGIHLTAYLCWAIAMAHGVGIGTDARASWYLGLTLGCGALVLAATTVRIVKVRTA